MDTRGSKCIGNVDLASVNVLEYEERLCIQYARHRLKLVENHAAEVYVIDCSDQQNYVKIAAHKCDVVHFRNRA